MKSTEFFFKYILKIEINVDYNIYLLVLLLLLLLLLPTKAIDLYTQNILC